MTGAQAVWLADGRLHLHHGPIDLIVDAVGAGRADALHRATRRFRTVLEELVGELPALRQPPGPATCFSGIVARRMAAAVAPFADRFVTPMAAVAGAVADEVLAALTDGSDIARAYVNNGGDVAFFLTRAQSMTAALAAPVLGRLEIAHRDTARGVATSGWRGRSHSLGIADAVTVLAPSAAAADAAATMIANAVDLPGHPAIARQPAVALSPDSDLGERLVTADVGPLSANEIGAALDRGATYAETCLTRGLICGAVLILEDRHRALGAVPRLSHAKPEPAHA